MGWCLKEKVSMVTSPIKPMQNKLFHTWLLQFVHPAGVGPDEASCEQMKQRGEYLSQKMTQLLHEIELSGIDWGALVFGAWQQWHLWPIAGVLFLLLGLFWWLVKRSPVPDSDSGKKSSGNSRKQEEESHENGKKNGKESKAEAFHINRDLERITVRFINWPMNRLAHRCLKVEKLVAEILRVFQVFISNSFLPVPQPAIGVGSAFEGWSPQEDEAVYCLLVPLKPPRGHSFHLELDNTREKPKRNFCIRVELECTCTSKQQEEEDDMLCFLHHPQKKLRRHQSASLLSTLCKKSYLDVHKTVHWFQNFVRGAFALLPQKSYYDMKVLYSNSSCKLLLTPVAGKSLSVEIILGVQQGDSDIFAVSQSPQTIFPCSTVWPESYAVAEVKFFRHIAGQVPCGSFHLKCLHVCTRILVGTSFFNDTLKTVVMHLLTTTEASSWCGKDFLLRLEEIMQQLHHCLQDRCLNHFFFGNTNVPKEILLPPDFQKAKPINLFENLVEDPYAYERALHDFRELQDRLSKQIY